MYVCACIYIYIYTHVYIYIYILPGKASEKLAVLPGMVRPISDY